jgi:hypothetical protein
MTNVIIKTNKHKLAFHLSKNMSACQRGKRIQGGSSAARVEHDRSSSLALVFVFEEMEYLVRETTETGRIPTRRVSADDALTKKRSV